MACIRLETQPFVGPGCRPTEGPVGPQAVTGLGPKAWLREELERGGTPALINQYRRPSASEVGLNIHPCQPQPFGPGWCHQPGAKVSAGCWKETFGPGWWHQPGLKGRISPGWCHQPGPLPTFGPGWCHQPGPKTEPANQIASRGSPSSSPQIPSRRVRSTVLLHR